MRMPVSDCAWCGSPLKPEEVPMVSAFRCPTCSKQIRVPGDYRYRLFLFSLLVGAAGSLGLGISLGIRGLHLVLAVLFSWVPVNYLFLRFMKYIVPPAT